MSVYFLRRLLLMVPTLLGATLVVFLITRITPGGPLEAAIQAASKRPGEGAMKDAGASLSEEQKEQLAAYYGFDRPFLPAYLAWLGLLPKEVDKQFVKWADKEAADKTQPITLRELLPQEQWTPNNAYLEIQAELTLQGELRNPPGASQDLSAWSTRAEPEKRRVQVFRQRHDGLLQGNLGVSTRYNEPVWGMIVERMPISLFYGIFSFLVTYLVCIPLGVLKAIRHRRAVDNLSSVLIFVGYAIPGFVLASVLVVYPAGRWGWFPMGGFVGEQFGQLGLVGKIGDLLHHAALPMICHLVGSFAFLTLMVKNNLMDNLAADFVRTAVAKGSTFGRAVFYHALRNSLIPVATTLGHVLSVFVAGSMLVEMIFEINGFGLLHYYSVVDRDYPLVMGILVIEVVLLMLGNLLSDFFVAAVDPRVRFD
jgi:microcin C transport system permease protein